MKNDAITHPLFDRQLALEEEMVSRGINTFRKKLADAKTSGRGSATAGGAFLVKKAIQPVSKAIQDFVKSVDSGKPGPKHVAAVYLRKVDPDVAAFIALRTCLNLLSNSITLQNVSILIGSALETEARLALFEKANKEQYRRATKVAERSNHERHRSNVYSYIAGKNDISLPAWSKRDKLLLGQKLVEIVTDTTGYVEVVADHGSTSAKKVGAGSYTYRMIGTKQCLDWLARIGDHAELATPEFLPTIIPPRPWEGSYNGGYFTNCKPLRLVKTGTTNYLEELSMTTDEMPVLYEAINAMQETGYIINKAVLEVMSQLWETGGDVAGLPSRENYKLPRCPFCGAEIAYGVDRGGAKHPCFSQGGVEETLKTWKREAAAVYEKNVINRWCERRWCGIALDHFS